MDDILQAVKDVAALLTGLGWMPIPLLISCVVMLAMRMALEPSVLGVQTPETLRRVGWTKAIIFFSTVVVTLLLQYGMQKPATGFDRALCIGFALGDTFVAYVVTSTNKVKGLIKNEFTKGDDNAKASPAPSV